MVEGWHDQVMLWQSRQTNHLSCLLLQSTRGHQLLMVHMMYLHWAVCTQACSDSVT